MYMNELMKVNISRNAVQGMTWEYKCNTHPTSYIKFRGWESQVHCNFGTGKGHLSCFLGLNQTKSGACDVPVWISGPGWNL